MAIVSYLPLLPMCHVLFVAFGLLPYSSFMAFILLICRMRMRLSLSNLFRSYAGRQARLLRLLITGGCRTK